jgi:hypothetical protein
MPREEIQHPRRRDREYFAIPFDFQPEYYGVPRRTGYQRRTMKENLEKYKAVISPSMAGHLYAPRRQMPWTQFSLRQKRGVKWLKRVLSFLK